MDNSLSLAGLILISLSIVFLHDEPGYPGWAAVMPVTGSVLVLLAGPHAALNRRLLSNQWLVRVGLISYPLYLWHWPIISYLTIIDGGTPTRPIRLAAFGVSLLLASLTYKLVERPLRFGIRARRLKTIFLATLMIIIGSLGYYIKMKQGFPERVHIQPYIQIANLMAPLTIIDSRVECLVYAPLIPPNGYCAFTDVGSEKTVAVIGDSHAYSAYPGMAEINKSLGFNTVLMGGTGFLPFQGLKRSFLSKADKELDAKLIEAIIATLLDKEDIRKVFIIVRGPFYFSEKNFKGEVMNNKYRVSILDYKNCLQRTVQALAKVGKKVYIVTENPEFKENVYHKLPRPLRRAKPIIGLAKSEVMEWQREYLQMLDQIDGAQVVNLLDVFCPDPSRECIAFSPTGLPLYFDLDHLTSIGSIFQAESLKEYVISE